ncbi:PAS domain-containing protein [Hymenobacter busanensis]|uniref:histidine kinase n=1 Tax=Hymenobacter busanensis TaxID=2607656 RepID=A0A7L5A2I2_9BACT|nr:PAS domain-containing protein [Hymenobacter busanensis]KAA9338192.1 PAS domain-containing protein [Hymenobacter busanensis]QHJ09383.1 PAS domain-containing protein [Hymenobacter busanensis]
MALSVPLPAYLQLFRHWPGNCLLLLPDAEFTIVDNTNGHVAVSRKSRDAVVGRPLFEAFPATDLAQSEVLRASLEHVRDQLQPHTMPRIRYDLELPAEQGGGFEELYWQATHFPILDDAGQLQFILQQTEDVTTQHQAERRAAQLQAELAATQEHAHFLLEALPVMIWTTRPDGAADYQNPLWLAFTGRTLREARDWGWLDDIHPDDRPHVQQAWQQALADGGLYEVEYRLHRHDGQYRWILVRGVPRRDAAGAITGWIGTGTDIHEQKQVQQQLEAKDQQLQRILQHLPAIVNTMEGPEHRYTYLSPQIRQLIGDRAQVGDRVVDAQPEIVEQGFLGILDNVYRTGTPFSAFEQRVDILHPQTQQLETHYFNFSYQVLPEEEHQPETRGLLSFAIDVTEQVVARQRADALATEVRRRDERLRRMTEALPAISFICAPTGELEYVSPQWYQVTGQPADADANAVWPTLIHPEDGVLAREFFRTRLLGSTPWEYEYRLRRHDGQYRWHLCRAVPELSDDGKPVRWFGTLVDNHAQKELQNELVRSERHFRFLAESVPQIIWTATPDGRVEYFNQRLLEATGLRPEDCLGSSAWGALLHPDDLQRSFATWQQAYQTGTRYEIEYRFVARTGGFRWFLGRAEPLHDETGAVVRWFGSCTDIHDVKQTQEELLLRNTQLTQTNQDLDNFVYTASHDLKQPVDNMAGIFAELARSARFTDPAAHRLVTMFEGALQQIHTTIRDLSAVVQVQRQHEQLVPELVELRPFAEEAIRSVQLRTDDTVAHFELDFAAVPALLFVRPNLQSIFYNLLSNALKYAHPERRPVVRLATEWAGATPVLVVQDNGLGIDLERHGPELFQMFRRFHTHVDGSGIGLYLVNRIVQQLGGQLEVVSVVGEGTTFRLHLPEVVVPEPSKSIVDYGHGDGI